MFTQDGFEARCDWADAGIRALGPGVEVLVLVDVLSFTTALDVALARGASVYPYSVRDQAAAAAFATSVGAALAVNRGKTSAEAPFSLSPASLSGLRPGARLVLPSPNGSTLSVLAGSFHRTVLAGCLRNAGAVAAAAARLGRSVGVIAAGERWPNGTLRPAVEDLVGAGAILSHLSTMTQSPEAELAVAAFEAVRGRLDQWLRGCASGRELAALGYSEDVAIAAELDVSRTVPCLRHGAYIEVGSA